MIQVVANEDDTLYFAASGNGDPKTETLAHAELVRLGKLWKRTFASFFIPLISVLHKNDRLVLSLQVQSM